MSIVRFGAFGKVETFGDYVSVGTSSTTGRSFEKWCQMANDQVASAKRGLPEGPFGFYYRNADAESLLVGVMVGSRDKVGRPSPLSVFFETKVDDANGCAGLAGAYRGLMTELSALAVRASTMAPEELRAAIGAIEKPDHGAICAALSVEIARLGTIPLGRMLDRIFGPAPGPAHALEILARACDKARSMGPNRPTTVDVRASSDAELLFWLRCLERRLGGSVGLPSTFWDVNSERILLIPGVPDANTLCFLCPTQAEHSRLWRTKASEEAEQAARERLNPEIAKVLADPTATAEELIGVWAS